MNKKLIRIRHIIMATLVAFGIGILILVQLVERNNLTEFREPITLAVRIYQTLAFLYIIFLNAIPLAWSYFKKNKS